MIPLSQIQCIPDRKITTEARKKLQSSMNNRIAKGEKPLILPLLIDKCDDEGYDYKVVDGKCRFLALEKISVTELCLGGEKPDMVFSEGDPRILAFAANDIRNNLSLQEQVDFINDLIESGREIVDIAAEIGCEPRWVARRANLRKLAATWQEPFKTQRFGWMTLAHYEAVATFSEELQEEIFAFVCGNQWSLRSLSIKKFEAELVNQFATLLAKLPWGNEQGCGECPACLDRLNNGFLIPEMNDPKKALCQNRVYLADKRRQYIADQVAENPELVLIAHDPGNCQIEDSSDPLYGANIIAPGLWTECKASKGGKKAIAIDTGAEVYVKVSNPKNSGKNGEKSSELTATEDITAGKTKTLAERKAAKHKQRQRRAISKLIDFIGAFNYTIPDRETLFILIACRGIGESLGGHYDYEERKYHNESGIDACVSSFKKAKEHPELDKFVWHKLSQEIISSLKRGQAGAESPCWDDAETIAGLIDFSMEQAFKEAVEELPDPQSWLKLEAEEAKAA
jgi:hypothetical protein